MRCRASHEASRAEERQNACTAQTGIMADLRDREYNNVMNNLIDVVQKMPMDQFAYR